MSPSPRPRSPLSPLPLLLAFTGSAACAVLLGEGTSGALADAACPEWGRGQALGASYSGQPQLDAQIGVFVQSARDLSRLTARLRDEVRRSCVRMAQDLAVSIPNASDDDPRPVCAAVTDRARAIVAAAGQARLDLQVTPPRCTVDANLEARCHAECKVNLDPGQIVARCEPGKLAGTCDGTCRGTCDGTCTGACSGTCSPASGTQCQGDCQGTCQGTCSGTCHAQCSGTWQAPRCEGKLRGPSADADCAASCRARADVQARCTPARVTARASASTGDLARLAATLRANLPALITAEVRLARQIGADVRALADAGTSLRGRLQSAGSHALACVSAAVNATAEASLRVSVTVEASASVTGSVGATAD